MKVSQECLIIFFEKKITDPLQYSGPGPDAGHEPIDLSDLGDSPPKSPPGCDRSPSPPRYSNLHNNNKHHGDDDDTIVYYSDESSIAAADFNVRDVENDTPEPTCTNPLFYEALVSPPPHDAHERLNTPNTNDTRGSEDESQHTAPATPSHSPPVSPVSKSIARMYFKQLDMDVDIGAPMTPTAESPAVGNPSYSSLFRLKQQTFVDDLLANGAVAAEDGSVPLLARHRGLQIWCVTVLLSLLIYRLIHP